MNILSVFQNIRTLRIKFLSIILPPVIICFLIFSIVLAFLTYRDMEIQLDTETRKIADLQSKALALPLWNYLDQDVKQTLETLLLNPDVIKAVVRDTKGRVIARAGKADDKGIYKGEVQIEREITFQFVPTGAKRTIGYLAITFHRGRIYEILYKQFIRDSFLLLLLVIAIVGSALAANKLAIEIPLYRLLRAIRKADEEDVREIVHWPARDELGQVIKAYNSLIESLKVAEKSLKEHSEHLEEMVEQRTNELQEAQEQLVRTEKLAAIGQLASGIGHELRNPLGVIGNSAYYLNTKLKDADEKVIKHVSILQREVHRANKIITDLLDFSRVRPPSLEKSDVNSIVKDTLAEIKVPENISIETQLDGKLPRIPLDPDQIRQVFLNIISNALDVMPEGGRLDIETGVKGDFVEIMLRDTGEGIPEENLQRVFDPLFTTKARGIGLGLAIVRSIIDGHEGTIEVESPSTDLRTGEVGKGTTFTVKLPVG